MKSYKNLLEQLETFSHFHKGVVYQLGKQFALSDASIDTYISRFLKRKEILQLKKGLYVSTNFFSKNRNDISYSFYLANVLRTPSYVSSWAALQYYDLATESIHAITSVTPKVTREYRTNIGLFSYQSIKKELFSDFSLIKGTFDFFIASPSKALFDLLYLRTHQFRGMNQNKIREEIEALRIDFDEMSPEEHMKFKRLTESIPYE